MKGATAGLLLAAAVLTGRAAQHDFPHPDRIRYDAQCFTIDGQDRFIFGGSFAYFRCPPELWRERFRALQAAGCNTVETSVPWNWYERTPPSSPAAPAGVDFSDLREWLRIAHDEFGFYTIVRPGPYIGAGWDGGGFPRWLLTERPAALRGRWLRTADPTYLAWSAHWFRAVCAAIAPGQVYRRPPGTGGTILVQLENEFDPDDGIPSADRVAALKGLRASAQAAGIDVPLFTSGARECRDSDDPALTPVFDAVGVSPRSDAEQTAAELTDLLSAQPDAPALLSDLPAGRYRRTEDPGRRDLAGPTAAEFQAEVLLAIANGATAINAGLAVGGTNFGRWAARDLATSSDGGAPIGEWGETGAKYGVLTALGQLIRAHGAELARARPVNWSTQSGSLDVAIGVRVERSGAAWFFFRNRSGADRRRGRAAIWSEKAGEIGVDYDLAPLESRALRLPPASVEEKDGEWLPEAGGSPAAGPPARGAQMIAMARMAPPLGRAHSFLLRLARPGALLPQLGIWDARPVIYRAEPELTPAEASAGTLHMRVYSDDRVVADVNGRIVAGSAHDGIEDLPIAGTLAAGRNEIQLLYYQGGQGDAPGVLEDEAGLRSAAIGERPLTGLTFRPLDLPDEEVESPLVAAYRGTFDFALTAADGPVNLRIDASGDGELFFNGHALGRYWEAGTQRRFFLPACWLKPHANEILVYLAPGAAHPPAIRSVAVEPYPISSAKWR